MKTLSEIIQILQHQKSILAEEYGIKEIGVFGSFLRGEQTGESDIDILVEFEKPIRIGLIVFIGIENYLSDLLGVKVDLVIKENLKPRIGKHILQEVVML